MIDWITRWLLLPGAVYVTTRVEGKDSMVDEKLRKEMGQLMEQGRKREALELSRIIDVQVFTAMQQYLKIPILA